MLHNPISEGCHTGALSLLDTCFVGIRLAQDFYWSNGNAHAKLNRPCFDKALISPVFQKSISENSGIPILVCKFTFQKLFWILAHFLLMEVLSLPRCSRMKYLSAFSWNFSGSA